MKSVWRVGQRTHELHRSGELEIPPAARGDPEATEMLRAWIAAKGLHCILRPDRWEDVGAWGILLADVARHVANAMAEQGLDRNESLARIRELFNEELDDPSDEPSGRFVDH